MVREGIVLNSALLYFLSDVEGAEVMRVGEQLGLEAVNAGVDPLIFL